MFPPNLPGCIRIAGTGVVPRAGSVRTFVVGGVRQFAAFISGLGRAALVAGLGIGLAPVPVVALVRRAPRGQQGVSGGVKVCVRRRRRFFVVRRGHLAGAGHVVHRPCLLAGLAVLRGGTVVVRRISPLTIVAGVGTRAVETIYAGARGFAVRLCRERAVIVIVVLVATPRAGRAGLLNPTAVVALVVGLAGHGAGRRVGRRGRSAARSPVNGPRASVRPVPPTLGCPIAALLRERALPRVLAAVPPVAAPPVVGVAVLHIGRVGIARQAGVRRHFVAPPVHGADRERYPNRPVRGQRHRAVGAARRRAGPRPARESVALRRLGGQRDHRAPGGRFGAVREHARGGDIAKVEEISRNWHSPPPRDRRKAAGGETAPRRRAGARTRCGAFPSYRTQSRRRGSAYQRETWDAGAATNNARPNSADPAKPFLDTFFSPRALRQLNNETALSGHRNRVGAE